MNAHVENRSNEVDAAAPAIDSANQEKQAKIDPDGGNPQSQSSDPHIPPLSGFHAACSGCKPLV